MVDFTFINYGRTPALKFFEVTRFGKQDNVPDPRRFHYDSSLPTYILFPSAPDSERWPRDATHWDSLSAHYYFMGKIWYQDYWGNKYWSTFDYEFSYRANCWQRNQNYEAAGENDY